MGIKLIYYKLADGKLSFGSEIRPVLAAEDSRPEVDPDRAEFVFAVPLHAVAADNFSRRPKTGARHDAGGGKRQMPRGTLV